MRRKLKTVFVCEFITGGGLLGEDLPERLMAEGELMTQAVVRDFLALKRFHLIVARDPRLPSLDAFVDVVTVNREPWEQWVTCIQRADAVLAIAPETGGGLERLNRLILAHDRVLLGCAPEAVAIAASKLATAQRLAEREISVVPTVALGADLPASANGWTVKPDDGAGSEETYILFASEAVKQRAQALFGRQFVVQPFLPGDPMSLSLLCTPRHVRVLACNRQIQRRDGASLRQDGVIVNGAAHKREQTTRLAEAILAAVPGLLGYVGVDFIDSVNGPVVLEINPRLTTAYAGLSQSLGVNAAELILRACEGDEKVTAISLDATPCRIERHC